MLFTEEEFLAAAEKLDVTTDVYRPLEQAPEVYVLILHKRGVHLRHHLVACSR